MIGETMTEHRRPRPRSIRIEEDFFRLLAELVRKREPLVLVTVASASGSAPGKAGGKMIVTAETQHGTVGGGRVENATVTRARELLGSTAGPQSVDYDVVQDLGMSCGGSMTVLFEPITPPPRLVIFGAGHISESLCAIASLVGFDVTVCDEREDWLTEERFPKAKKRIVAELETAVAEAGIDTDTLVASATPGHAFDQRVIRAIFERDMNPRYLGVIGSRRKAVLFRKELVEGGIPESVAETIRIPMGLNIGAAEPREIALSIMAEMVALLRGVETVEW